MIKLSHYTNIDSLEKILESNSFKFNSLRNMNDPFEGRAIDFKNFSNILFCSSWTKDNSKNGVKYMWENYTRNKCGVRITLPKNPFKKYLLEGERIINECNAKSLIPPKYYSFICGAKPPYMENDLFKISYTDDFKQYLPKITNGNYIEVQKLGLFKSKKWEKEKEWRYLITAIPYWLWMYDNTTIDEGLSQFNLQEIFVDLKDGIIEQMEVLPSKNLSKKNMEFLKRLRDKYNFKIIE